MKSEKNNKEKHIVLNKYLTARLEANKRFYSRIKNDNKIFTSDQNFPLNKDFIPNLFPLNIEEFNNNFQDDMSESGYLIRNFETSLDEIYEGLTYYVTTEK